MVEFHQQLYKSIPGSPRPLTTMIIVLLMTESPKCLLQRYYDCASNYHATTPPPLTAKFIYGHLHRQLHGLALIVVSSILKQTSTVQSHKYSAVLPLLTRLSQHCYECRATLFLSPPQHDLCCTISSFSSIGDTCGTSATSSCPI